MFGCDESKAKKSKARFHDLAAVISSGASIRFVPEAERDVVRSWPDVSSLDLGLMPSPFLCAGEYIDGFLLSHVIFEPFSPLLGTILIWWPLVVGASDQSAD